MPRDTSFFYAFLMLPPARRGAIIAVWDFCRAVDDAVDESDAPARAAVELAQWRDELDRCFSGREPVTPQGRALVPLIAAYGLHREPFDDLIDGVQMDLRQQRYATFEDLTQYCRRVASAVGLVCVQIFGCREPAAREYAINLGIALQLTNIVRDVGADLGRGRIYLPQEDLHRFGVTDRELAEGRVTDAIRELLAFQCQRARDYFARAARALPQSEARKLIAAEIMGAIYAEILRRVERNDYDVFSETIRVPKPVRAWIAVTTWARAMSRAIGAEPVHA